jgi:hypothetical protein
MTNRQMFLEYNSGLSQRRRRRQRFPIEKNSKSGLITSNAFVKKDYQNEALSA